MKKSFLIYFQTNKKTKTKKQKKNKRKSNATTIM